MAKARWRQLAMSLVLVEILPTAVHLASPPVRNSTNIEQLSETAKCSANYGAIARALQEEEPDNTVRTGCIWGGRGKMLMEVDTTP